MIAVDVKSSGSTFEAGTPRELFDSPYQGFSHIVTGTGVYHTYAVSADGQRFLIPHPLSTDAANLTMPIAVVENWAAGLKRGKVKSKKAKGKGKRQREKPDASVCLRGGADRVHEAHALIELVRVGI